MPQYDKAMSLEEHLEIADELAIATHYLSEIYNRCQKHYPKTNRLMKLLSKVQPSHPRGCLLSLKSELDNEYHRAIDDATFAEHGHIYYNLEERYKKMT